MACSEWFKLWWDIFGEEQSHLEDNNNTEEVDAGDEAKDGEDPDVVWVVQTQLGRSPEYRYHDPDLRRIQKICAKCFSFLKQCMAWMMDGCADICS